jgi:hypothetical protein
MSTAAKVFQNVKPVTVTVQNGYPCVGEDPIVLDKNLGESIEWVPQPANLRFTVCFASETPFAERHFHEHRPASGPVNKGATGRYKYTIEVGGVVLDPGVIVRP